MISSSSSSSASPLSLASSEDEHTTNQQAILAFVNAVFSLSNQPIQRISIRRNREAAHEHLMHNYFSKNPVYGAANFRRRFRMRKELFLRIVNDMESNYEYFTQRVDGRGKIGFTALQKCTSAIRQLAYGVVPDSCDEYLQMSERPSRESLQTFCKGIIALCRRQYLREPTVSDIHQLYAFHEAKHGFRGMLGSIDCTHRAWRNCPAAWRGQYMRGDHLQPTIMLEAAVSQDLWFWHAFFGVVGSNNDINVLQQSPLFNGTLNGAVPEIPFEVNGTQYKRGYFLVDRIYLEWSTFVKVFSCPTDAKRDRFKKAQESARKDIERAFGVLKARWTILAHHNLRSDLVKHIADVYIPNLDD